jgi:acyl dehydratase
MASAAERALSLLKPAIGAEGPPGDWHTVTQDQIDAFARTTLDDQFIHTDPVRAANESPFGKTIAHGFLTLSMISYLVRSIPRPRPEDDPTQGRRIGINYGLEKVRFPNPVRVNSRIRARQALVSVELKDAETLQLTHRTTVEIDGEPKPACVADWITRAIYA